MNYIQVLLNQLGLMFIVIFLGFFLRKINFTKDEFFKDLGNFLIYVINPIAIFKSFCTELTSEKVYGLLVVSGVSLFVFIAMVVIANIFYKDRKYCVENFACVLDSCGFFGIPIVASVLGSEYVMYVVPFNIVDNIFLYTYGAYILSRDKKDISVKKVITNPNIIASILGLIVFVVGIPMPGVLLNTFDAMSAMMGIMCSLIIGGNLATTTFKNQKFDFRSTLVYPIRLLVTPIIVLFVMVFIPCDINIKMTVLIAASTPAAASTTILARNYNQDFVKGALIVSVSSLLTIVSMPLVFYLMPLIW